MRLCRKLRRMADRKEFALTVCFSKRKLSERFLQRQAYIIYKYVINLSAFADSRYINTKTKQPCKSGGLEIFYD